MTAATKLTLPTHLDLPETDGLPMENAIQMFQIALLSEVLRPVLAALHPDGRYLIAQDVGIYYRRTDPPLDGCKAPDWFYVPDVDPLIDGEYRRSYVLWNEPRVPPILVEFSSSNGSVEHDATPPRGKFWVYEQMIGSRHYVIFNVDTEELEVFELVDGRYRPMSTNERERFPIEPLGIELGVWHGAYQNYTLPWLRAYRPNGSLLPTPEETAEQERERADQERERADQERERAEQERERAEQEGRRVEQERRAKEAAVSEKDRLAAKLRELGFDSESV
jgi:Uma2 family endonuclease